ncbi:hypothetical protein OK016_18950 [Vibrio chagasii]|nr:hypothetical protein [Vibrio chagasii]
MKLELNKKKAGLEFMARIAWGLVVNVVRLIFEVVAKTGGRLGEAFGMLIHLPIAALISLHRWAFLTNTLNRKSKFWSQEYAYNNWYLYQAFP